VRLFIAVNLPAEERRAAYEAAAPLRAARLPVRWVREDALHVTLRFLGEIGAELAGPLAGAIAGAVRDARPFAVAVGGVGAFPGLAQPRVVWMGVERHPALELLAHDVERTLLPLGFEAELRPFHPHLTLGRVERSAKSSAFRDLERLAAGITYQSAIQVESVDLMQSTLGPAGATYDVVSRAVLSGAPRDAGAR
jgi:2'-5' RNA ligase